MKIQTTKVYGQIQSAVEQGYRTISEQGSARCFGEGTLIRMYDGRLKAVEDIVVGDRLINKDGKGYNTVIETHSGEDELYCVHQKRGEDYIVNSKHILSLRQTRAKMHKVAIPGYKSAEKRRIEMLPYDRSIIYDIPINEYIHKSKNEKLRYSGFKNTMIELPEVALPIDPYYFGVWLGDGTSRNYYEITNTDKEIIEWFYDFAKSLGTYAFQKDSVSHKMKVSTKKLCVPINDAVAAYKDFFYDNNLLNNKHIPEIFIYNSYENRLKLLAGLIDTDGYQTKRNTIQISQKRKEIMDAVLEICRLSGFYTNGICEKDVKMKRKDGTIYHSKAYILEINHSDFNDLNRYLKVPRRRIEKNCDRDYFCTSLDIQSIGYGKFYGFTLDNSPHFLLADGTVCHNSGKTHNTLIWLVGYLINHPKLRCSIVRETMPALRRSVLVDFKEVVEKFGYPASALNKSDFTYTFPNGSWIEFFGCDSEQKLRGPKRDILYVNEGNELKYIEWQQLALRTTMFKIVDYNPSFSDDHWLCSVNVEPKTYHFITTYKDNPFLEQTIIDEIESLQYKNKSLWQVYGLGMQAVIEGLIFKDNVEFIDEIPEYAKKVNWRGMDFGFSCFTEDTLITTDKGQIRIADIKAGDSVLTRRGWKKVLQRKVNGYKEVTRKFIKFKNGQTTQIESTPEHLFLTNGEKWKKYKELTNEDTLYVLLDLTEKPTTVIQKANIPTIISPVMGEKKKNTDCTGTSMSISKGLSQKGVIFTILMGIRSIITSTISCLLRSQSIKNFIIVSENIIKRIQMRLQSDGFQKRIGRIGGILFSNACRLNLVLANIAGQNSSPQIHTKDFALKSATINGNIAMPQNCKKSVFARIAERNFWETNTLNQNAVAISALTNWQDIEEIKIESTREALVYDLWIEDCHEYFANGILVHNCDPTAIIDFYFWNNTIFLDEICYNTEMLTSDIIRVLKENGGAVETISESADPRMIAEIYRGGVNIHPVKKYPGSVIAGIQKMLEYKIKITKRSTNAIKEFKNYTWAQDKEGKWLNQPIDAYNHIIDACRYVVTMKLMGGQKKPLNIDRLANLAQ